MRFKNSDLSGMLIAMIVPVLIMALFFEVYEVWHHHGSPLLGAIATHVAIGAGVLAAFVRFVRSWEVPITLAGLLGLIVVALIALRVNGSDDTDVALAGRWAAIVVFLLLNASVGWQVLNNGLLPVLDRRDARKAAERAAG